MFVSDVMSDDHFIQHMLIVSQFALADSAPTDHIHELLHKYSWKVHNYIDPEVGKEQVHERTKLEQIEKTKIKSKAKKTASEPEVEKTTDEVKAEAPKRKLNVKESAKSKLNVTKIGHAEDTVIRDDDEEAEDRSDDEDYEWNGPDDDSVTVYLDDSKDVQNAVEKVSTLGTLQQRDTQNTFMVQYGAVS